MQLQFYSDVLLVDTLDRMRLMSGFWYLSTPYTNYPDGREAAFIAACRLRAKLMMLGLNCYSPIAETHPVQIHGELEGLSHEFMMADEQPKMDAACGLISARMESWSMSRGMAQELAYFKSAGKPIVVLDP